MSYIHIISMDQFVADCDAFKDKYGPRWTVPQSLRDLAAAGKSIYDYEVKGEMGAASA